MGLITCLDQHVLLHGLEVSIPTPPQTHPTNISLFTMFHIQVSTWANIHHDTLEHTSWFRGMSLHHVCIYMNLLPTFHWSSQSNWNLVVEFHYSYKFNHICLLSSMCMFHFRTTHLGFYNWLFKWLLSFFTIIVTTSSC